MGKSSQKVKDWQMFAGRDTWANLLRKRKMGKSSEKGNMGKSYQNVKDGQRHLTIS
jgi:hypothetical protein